MGRLARTAEDTAWARTYATCQATGKHLLAKALVLVGPDRPPDRVVHPVHKPAEVELPQYSRGAPYVKAPHALRLDDVARDPKHAPVLCFPNRAALLRWRGRG